MKTKKFLMLFVLILSALFLVIISNITPSSAIYRNTLGTTINLNIVDSTNDYTIDFNSMGGSSVTSITRAPGSTYGVLETPIKADNNFLGWYTDPYNGVRITSSTVVTGSTTLYARYAKIVCKKAVSDTRHTESCVSGATCTNFYQAGDTITYGTIPTSNSPISGDAYDCDVNNDGTYNPTTERFYYIKRNTDNGVDNAVLVHFSSYDENGQMLSDKTRLNYLYDDAKTHLPDSTIWTNPALISFNGKVSRFITIDDLTAGCGSTPTGGIAYFQTCQYFLEASRFQSKNLGRAGIWVEKENNTYHRIQTEVGGFASVDDESKNTVRPVIEIPYNTIDGYKEKTQYTVRFDSKGGSNVPDRYIMDGQQVGALTTPTREGYRFLGWYTDDTTYQTEISATTVITGNVTFYARWEALITNLDYVFYIPGECTFGGINGSITSSENNCISTINPTGNAIDYTLSSGKYIDTGVSLYSTTNIGKDYEIGFTIEDYDPSANVNRATFMNTKKEETGYPGLTFRRNETTNDLLLQVRNTSSANLEYTVAASTVTSVKINRIGGDIYYSINDGPRTLIASPSYNPTFNLTAWFGAAANNPAGTTAQRHLVGTLSNMYVKLQPDAVVNYTVHFDGNGGQASISSKEVTRGSQIGELPTATYTGHHFDGWYTEASGGTQIDEDLIIMGEVTFHAHWRDEYVVTFEGGNGTVSINPNTITVADGDSIGANNLPTANYPGNYFDGWYTAANGGTKITGTEVISQTTYYYAHYKAIHYITFHEEGGTINIAQNPMPVGDGESIGAANLPTASKTNNRFLGWYTAPSGGTAITGTEVISQDDDYYAQYSSVCTVTFDGNGGTPYFSSKDVACGTAIGELPTADNTNIMLDLEGWYLDLNDSSTKADATNTIISSNVTYHAKWITTTKVAMIGVTKCDTLAEAVSLAPITGTRTTITMLNNTSENVTIDGGRNIYLDVNGKTISNTPSSVTSTATQVLTVESATLEIVNGTVTSNRDSGMINVNSGGTLKVGNGAILRATSKRQAIFIDGGTAYINDGATVSSTTDQRATIQNKTNGTLVITGGTITSTNGYAIYNENGNITIGTKDGVVDTSKPIITGKTYAIVANSTYKFYDGILKGETAPGGKTSSTGNTPTVSIDTGETKMSEIETGTEKTYEDETGTSYKMLYLSYQSGQYQITLNPSGGEVSPSLIPVTPGSQVGTLPTPTRGLYTFEGWYDSNDQPVSSTTTPSGSETYHAVWSFTPTHGSVNIINDPMSNYFSNVSSWKTNESSFLTSMESNFNSYNCLPCDASSNYQSCPATGENQCDRPRGYSTGVPEALNVYEAVQTTNPQTNETTWTKGNSVNYVTVTSDGTIYDMLPGKTYYWEAANDVNVYGTVAVTGQRRILEAGGVRNIRDLGGFAVDVDGNGTVDGTIDYGRMFRGPKLNTSADVTSLTTLGVTKEVDLRGSSSDPQFTNYAGRTIRNYEIDTANFAQYATQFKQAITDTIDDLLNHENIYFHCAIGTDRTGTMAWFLEGLLGVSEEERVEDYELSYFYGLLNRHRFYRNQPGSSITHRFEYMYQLFPTNTDIYNYYTNNGTENVQKVQAFRNEVITYNH